MKNTISFCTIITIILVVLFSTISFAAESEYIDPNCPESWYHAPKLASDYGITEFNQSPLLDERVASGELPPVADRLPDDPPVLEPYEKVGRYGGSLTTYSTIRDWTFGGAWSLNWIGTGQVTPDGQKVVPSLVKDWEVSEDGKTWTIHLRKGMKWSDGEPLTADAWIYHWKHELNNSDLSPISPEEQNPPLLDITKKDDYTVVYEYGTSYGRKHHFEFPMGISAVPGHVLQDFHPDFVDEDEIVEKAKDVGLDEWYEYYGRIQGGYSHPEYETQPPTLRPYVCVERGETHLILERNPYYPFVDTEGNQLPYIDRIRVNFVNDAEMVNMKASMGEADWADFWPDTRNLPLFKKNSQKEGYKFFLYGRTYQAMAIQLNLSHKDPDMRELFHDVRFRRALSLAIDREAVNDKVYLGAATPAQSNVVPSNKFYVEGVLEAYADFDPERAEKMLDDMGMVDVDGDGWRERPDGVKFNPTWLYCDIAETSAVEMVAADWKDIGINVDIKSISRQLYQQERWVANNGDIGVWVLDPGTSVAWGNNWHIVKSWAPIYPSDPGATPWPGYISWYSSKGEEGIEPTERIKELTELAKILAFDADPEARLEAGKKLVKAQAENLWTIGVVSSVPKPVILNEKLKNVPETLISDWGAGLEKPARPCQFYLEE